MCLCDIIIAHWWETPKNYATGCLQTVNKTRYCGARKAQSTSFETSTEPRLQSMHDEVLQLQSANRDNEARLGVRASDFWYKGQEAIFEWQ